jgi:hypothetical protein
MDFSRLVELFDRHNVTFVSVTQSFNTTTSMGRLTLNILLSFAQFEREVIGERIRDKFAASRRKGMWMGGFVPLGYDVNDRKLVLNEREAATVRMIFERFTKIGSATTLVRALRTEGIAGKRGKLIDKGYLYKLLNNRVYVGEAVHKGTAYPGEHEAIVDRALWDRVHSILQESPRQRAANSRNQTPPVAGFDLRTNRRGDDANHGEKGQSSLPLLCLDGRDPEPGFGCCHGPAAVARRCSRSRCHPGNQDAGADARDRGADHRRGSAASAGTERTGRDRRAQ